MTKEHATVFFLSEAKTGDMVWLYDGNQNAYDADNKYIGRGAWKLTKISQENKASFVCGASKFDRKTGVVRIQNGYRPMQSIYGEKEKNDKIWLTENRYKLSQRIEKCNDVSTLRAVANLLIGDGL